MCRLFGWSNPELPERTDRARLLKHLARKSQAGGEASFGMAMVKDGKPQAIRYIGAASLWLEANKKKLPDYAKSDIIVGHTRQPTKGAVTKANTHPFTIGEWAAAHNGMISNSTSLMEAALYAPRGETDSEEALCFIISNDWDPEALEKITGSYAFTGAKADGSEVVLACDSAQNLHYVKFGNGLVWATSAIVLKSSLLAVGIDAEPVKMKSQVLRLPSWDTHEIAYTPAYQTYQGYSGYGHSHVTPAATTFPIVPKDGSSCKCGHPVNAHEDPGGCRATNDNRICPCMETPKELKDIGECPICKHDKVSHSTSWGCMRCECKEGQLPVTTGASQPGLPLSAKDSCAGDVCIGDGEVITEAEMEALRLEGINAVDM
jgi:predicted glutamine amidotransferase